MSLKSMNGVGFNEFQSPFGALADEQMRPHSLVSDIVHDDALRDSRARIAILLKRRKTHADGDAVKRRGR